MTELTWYAVKVLAGQRVRPTDDVDAPFLIERKLRQRGFETFAPRRTVFRHSNGVTAKKRQKREVPRPILPGWVFVGWPATVNKWRELNDCPGVVGVAMNGQQPGQISDRAMRSFASRFGDGLLLAHERERHMRSRAEYAPGQDVRIVGGGLDGHVAKLVSAKGRDAKILLTLFGTEREVEIDTWLLEAA